MSSREINRERWWGDFVGETERLLWGLAGIVALGIGAQWLAWRLRLPAILLLLAAGFLAGPVTGWIDVEGIFGKLLIPVVSLSVAMILFEGGLNLRIAELKKIGGVLTRLLSFGVVVSWLLGTAGAYWLLDLPGFVSLLLGAILVVTGPTVIGPLLRQIRPEGQVAAVAKWEGITIDPVGAVLAVLVFEAGEFLQTASLSETTWHAGAGLLRTILFGGSFGVLGAAMLIILLKRFWVPDYLQIPVALGIAVISFAASNHFQHESGLLAVTVMGVLVANLSAVPVKHIIEFKENLSVLLISGLFVLLAARVQVGDLQTLGWESGLFVAFLILVVRPAAVFLATIGAGMPWRERLFLSCLAPRGIVAAAVASVFALHLETHGDRFAANVLLVVVATVSIYGLSAGPLARRLGLAEQNPQGVLVVGAYPGARAIAHALQENGFRVMLVDNNHWHIKQARMEGLPTYFGNILSEEVEADIDLGGIGRLIALTPNDEVNSLAAHEFRSLFGRANVFQLAAHAEEAVRANTPPPHLRGRRVFGPDVTFDSLQQRFATGAIVKATSLTEEFDYDAFCRQYGENVVPLFVITENGHLTVVTAEGETKPKPQQTIIAVVDAAPDEENSGRMAKKS